MSDVRDAELVADPVAIVKREQAGMLAMATMSEAEFGARLVALKRGQDRIKQIKQELMEANVHFGVIPGTQKPTLLKPGAEVLCSIYGLRPDFIPTIHYGDNQTAPAIRALMRCELHLGDITGPVVAVGYGSANSWEKKHRYRRGERACPTCGVVGQIIKGKEEFGGGWLCWQRKGGCGAKFPDGAAEIESQQASDVENADPYELENTLVKMSKKRALLDAALTGTASSDLFTQDMEEAGPSERDHSAPAKPTVPTKPAQAQPAPKPANGSATKDATADAQCPKCGKPAMYSQWAKPGQTHYCNPKGRNKGCGHKFEPASRAPEPGDEPWDGEPIDEGHAAQYDEPGMS
jgi:ssDNA-binding Zn-finger/Zn-ribbon topoisomerase 1